MENNIFNWNMDPEIINLGILSLRWYGLLFAAGFVIGFYIMKWMFKIEGKKIDELDNLTVYMAISTVLGARLGHVFFYNWDYYSSDLIKIFYVWEGGLASHGAAIGILIGLYLFVRKRPEFSYLWLVDRIVVGVALAGFFIRLGNFMNSEIVGLATDGTWGVLFQRSYSYGDVPRHPVQLYEAFSYLLIFVFMYFRYAKKKASIAKGELFGWFLVLVFGARFVWEFFKVKQVESATHFAMTTDLNMGHYLSIPLVLIGLGLLINSLRKK